MNWKCTSCPGARGHSNKENQKAVISIHESGHEQVAALLFSCSVNLLGDLVLFPFCFWKGREGGGRRSAKVHFNEGKI